MIELHHFDLKISLLLTFAIVGHIIYLTREPIARTHLAAGKIKLKNSALLYQSRGTIFYVIN